jgi:transcriptional regulator with XRE-family HTH domain
VLLRLPRRRRPGPRRGDDVSAQDRVRLAVRVLRTEQGLTQDQVVERMSAAGVPLARSALSQIEAGKRGISVDELEAFALVLGVTAGQLMDGTALDVAKLRRVAELRAEADRLERETAAP